MSLGTKQKIALLKARIDACGGALKGLTKGFDELKEVVDTCRITIGKLMAAIILLQEKGILTDDEIQEKYDSLINGSKKSSEGGDIQSEDSRPDEDSSGGTGSDVLSESGSSTDQGGDGDS